MKIIKRISLVLITAVLLSSCGAIPTLPPLESTISLSTAVSSLVPLRTSSANTQPVETLVILPSQTQVPQATTTKTTVPASATPRASATTPPTSTPTKTLPNTSTPTATPTTKPTATRTPTPMPYAVQQSNPYYLANFARPDQGCNWLGVAGQIFDSKGQVQKEIIIRAGGKIAGSPVIEDMAMPLSEPKVDLAYGPGGFEITLANQTKSTNKEAWIQLYNLAGSPLSEKIYLVTFADCQKNLILMNFSSK